MEAATLRALSILDMLDDAELRSIAEVCDEVVVPPAGTVFEQGSSSENLYVILGGHVQLLRNDRVVAEYGPGDFFGEMALFNRYERVATAVAVDTVRLFALRQRVIQPLTLRQEPAALKLLQRIGTLAVERIQHFDLDLVRRLAEQDQSLATALDDYRHLKQELLAGWALAYHSMGKPGKLGTTSTKPSATAADLSVAYSPGVAEPCVAIARAPETAYDFTGKGHLVGVVTNGTAVLGLGAIGALASKPVMEGKAVLFKRFADVDAFDIEIDEPDPERFVEHVVAIAPTFGGINLEDIAAPDCFEIERACKERLDIPVMHDDQHGTAIIIGAATLNALEIAGKALDEVRVVFAGAGAAGFAAAQHLLALGVRRDHLVLTDVNGVVYRGRGDSDYLAELASDTPARTLAEAIEGADVFVGVSVGGILTPKMLAGMAPNPVVMALANPRPEIEPALARDTRPDVLIGTGRSDYPNQINNVLAFPYLFRGALDIRATDINDAMTSAATHAIAGLAREPVTDEAGFDGRSLRFGRHYLIPKPFDRRLLPRVAVAVAEAGLNSGVARTSLHVEEYRAELRRLVRLL